MFLLYNFRNIIVTVNQEGKVLDRVNLFAKGVGNLALGTAVAGGGVLMSPVAVIAAGVLSASKNHRVRDKATLVILLEIASFAKASEVFKNAMRNFKGEPSRHINSYGGCLFGGG